MAEPTTKDTPVTASVELHIRAEALHAAHTAATDQCTRDCTSDNLRNAAAVGRTLAEVYRELAGEFCESAALFHAFCRARDHIIAEAQEYDAWADERQAHVVARG